MDAIKREALQQGIDDFLKRTSFPDEAAQRAACDDLLRRARVEWRDMLVLPLIATDPLPVRETAGFGLVIHELQEHAEPMWLPCAAVWQMTSADDPAVLEQFGIAPLSWTPMMLSSEVSCHAQDPSSVCP